MADLEELLQQLQQLDSQKDLDGLRQVRQLIALHHPDSDVAAEALYKLGLDKLFRQRDLQQAVDFFEEASKMKHIFWSAAARTSLGLCYYHQKKTQKALYELRKVGYAKHASSHSVTALAFLENILEQQEDHQEVHRVKKDRMLQLSSLIEQMKHAAQKTLDVAERDRHLSELGHYLYQLAIAYKDQGEVDKSKKNLQEAFVLGEDVLGKEIYYLVQKNLNALA